MAFIIGDYRRGRELYEEEAQTSERQGRIAWASADWAALARMHNALGDFEAAREAYERGLALSERLSGGASFQALQLAAARWEMRSARWVEIEAMTAEVDALVRQPAVETQWAFAAIRAAAAAGYAFLGRNDDALQMLGTLPQAMERAPLWAPNYLLLPCLAAATLRELDRTDDIDIVERNLRTKVIEPDLRYPMQDARLAMAWLCALQDRYDEAFEWFQKARDMLDEQGARPLRAQVDFEEAWALRRRGAPGDGERAAALIETALRQFRELDMPGWITRAESLRDAAR